MLNKIYTELCRKSNESKIDKKSSNESKKKKTYNYQDFFYPREKDSLFWIFYIIDNGFEKYENIKNKFTEEKESKIKYIEELRSEKHIFKTNKLSRPTIEGELCSDYRISMKSIKALAFLKQKNIIFIDNKKYYEIFPNVEQEYYCIEKRDHYYGFKKIDEEKLHYYQNNYWKLESLDKPIKAISSYKVSELKEICDKLNIQYILESGKSFTKQGLYNLILEKL